MSQVTLTNINDGDTPTASTVMSNFNAINTKFGSLDNSDVDPNAAINVSKLSTGAWTAYTLVWAGSGSNPAIGNGTATCRYIKIGRMVTAQYNILMGSTTTFGTGTYTFSLPYTAATVSNFNWIGMAVVYDDDTTKIYTGYSQAVSGATSINMYVGEAGTTTIGVATTTPISFAVNDVITAQITYESAS